MALLHHILKVAVPERSLLSYSRYLFFGPHPDDIEIGAGATIARLASLGKEICFVIVTDGRFGFTSAVDGMTPDELALMRRKEAIASAAALKVNDVRFLSLHDGNGYSYEELKLKMAFVIGSFRPDIIFAPDPLVPSECHQDHINTGMAARELAFFAPFGKIMETFGAQAAPVEAIAYYMSGKNNKRVRSKGGVKKQLDALFTYHRSQFPEGSEEAKAIRTYIRLRSFLTGLSCFSLSAEGFRVYSRMRMHCLPEA